MTDVTVLRTRRSAGQSSPAGNPGPTLSRVALLRVTLPYVLVCLLLWGVGAIAQDFPVTTWDALYRQARHATASEEGRSRGHPSERREGSISVPVSTLRVKP